MTGILIKRRNLETGTHSGRTSYWIYVATGKELPEARRQAWNRFFPDGFNRNMALSTSWFQTSGLQNYETINFCYSKSPSLWYFLIQLQPAHSILLWTPPSPGCVVVTRVSSTALLRERFIPLVPFHSSKSRNGVVIHLAPTAPSKPFLLSLCSKAQIF